MVESLTVGAVALTSAPAAVQNNNNNSEARHIQKAWDRPVAVNHIDQLLSRTSNEVDKARLLSATAAHSGDWLQAALIASVGLKLSDEAVRVAVAHRLGCRACEPHTCACGKNIDAHGLHGLVCRTVAGVHPDSNVIAT